VRLEGEIQQMRESIEYQRQELAEVEEALVHTDTLIPPCQAEVEDVQRQLADVWVAGKLRGCRCFFFPHAARAHPGSARDSFLPSLVPLCAQLDPESAARRLREQTSALKAQERMLTAESSLLYVPPRACPTAF
jgi:hypothetical protein